MAKPHRIMKIGNSSGITIAGDELDHIQAKQSDTIIITKAGMGRLILTKALPLQRSKKARR